MLKPNIRNPRRNQSRVDPQAWESLVASAGNVKAADNGPAARSKMQRAADRALAAWKQERKAAGSDPGELPKRNPHGAGLTGRKPRPSRKGRRNLKP